MGTRNISRGVKVTGVYGWQPYHLHVPTVIKYGSLNLLEHSRASPGLYRDSITITFTNKDKKYFADIYTKLSINIITTQK
jgi:hypothetical protein